MARCWYCKSTKARGRHNGPGGHLFIALKSILVDRCAVCGDATGLCVFGRKGGPCKGHSALCWYGTPCRVAA
jgi:hypothetical protein